ncbi:uncharacterized protein BDR25DRAFT_4618 [Lindgomyces ingoldianus]|uniref:Uncharacterized protein n=1 Tax=Lindgomyces ingoldianus TaxID=673940 RepID=A0ACB6RFN1_9PLEO|nr:uncharacterized protein BDR25DRAFT_4618 [Lindgomyces ingoldianus]KAF2477855.1 hypothetical protein BDR25DRAFT_4618 [Lindgomyces ingoldianus]
MKNAFAFSALVASAFAQDYFGVMSARSGSNIHLLPLNAIGGKFFLGGSPSSYCPPEVGTACPPGTSTVLAGGVGTLSLGVIVPGGQQVYIAPDGTMSYTAPHSAYKPEGSVVDGWSRSPVNDQFGYLTFSGGLVACPVDANNKPWQVYGQIASVTLSPQCLGFSALTINGTEAGAWEY